MHAGVSDSVAIAAGTVQSRNWATVLLQHRKFELGERCARSMNRSMVSVSKSKRFRYSLDERLAATLLREQCRVERQVERGQSRRRWTSLRRDQDLRPGFSHACLPTGALHLTPSSDDDGRELTPDEPGYQDHSP